MFKGRGTIFCNNQVECLPLFLLPHTSTTLQPQDVAETQQNLSDMPQSQEKVPEFTETESSSANLHLEEETLKHHLTSAMKLIKKDAWTLATEFAKDCQRSFKKPI